MFSFKMKVFSFKINFTGINKHKAYYICVDYSVFDDNNI